MAPGLLLNDASDTASKNSSISSASYRSEGHPKASRAETTTPVAVVGFALEFPQDATSADSFWEMLVKKRCASTEVPQERFNVDAFFGEDRTRNDTV